LTYIDYPVEKNGSERLTVLFVWL